MTEPKKLTMWDFVECDEKCFCRSCRVRKRLGRKHSEKCKKLANEHGEAVAFVDMDISVPFPQVVEELKTASASSKQALRVDQNVVSIVSQKWKLLLHNGDVALESNCFTVSTFADSRRLVLRVPKRGVFADIFVTYFDKSARPLGVLRVHEDCTLSLNIVEGFFALQTIEMLILGMALDHLETYGRAAAVLRCVFAQLQDHDALDNWSMLCKRLCVQLLNVRKTDEAVCNGLNAVRLAAHVEELNGQMNRDCIDEICVADEATFTRGVCKICGAGKLNLGVYEMSGSKCGLPGCRVCTMLQMEA